MDNNIFVNKTFDAALKKYILLERKGMLENSYDPLIIIIRCLIFIYGDLDIINPNITKDTKTLVENLSKYGYSVNEIILFFKRLDSLKNNEFMEIAKQIVEMFYMKSKMLNIKTNEKTEFLCILNKIKFSNLDEKYQIESYMEEKLKKLEENNNVEFLDFDPEIEKENINKRFNFQFDAVGGYISIMSILVIILLVCLGVFIINLGWR